MCATLIPPSSVQSSKHFYCVSVQHAMYIVHCTMCESNMPITINHAPVVHCITIWCLIESEHRLKEVEPEAKPLQPPGTSQAPLDHHMPLTYPQAPFGHRMWADCSLDLSRVVFGLYFPLISNWDSAHSRTNMVEKSTHLHSVQLYKDWKRADHNSCNNCSRSRPRLRKWSPRFLCPLIWSDQLQLFPQENLIII